MVGTGSLVKSCAKCGEQKPATTAHFNRREGDALRPECKACQAAYRKAYGIRKREELNRAAVEYRHANRDTLATKERDRCALLDPEVKRARNRAHGLKHQYGITVEQYDAMLQAQGGVCAICSRPPSAKSLCVDHDHETGAIRGLLCIRCNTALGTFGDNEAGLRKALDYLAGGGSWSALEVL